MIKKVRNTVPRACVINDLNGYKTVGISYENELQKTNQKGFRIEKVVKKKGCKYIFSRKDTMIRLTAP